MGETRKITLKPRNIGQNVSIDPTPYKAITDYYEIKNEVPIVKKIPEKDMARLTPMAGLISARRQLEAALDTLDAKRSEGEVWKADQGENWEELRKKQLSLRDSFIRFHQFVKENHEKRLRAMEKINKEKEIQERRREEMINLQRQIKHFRVVEMQLEALVAEYQVYREFLQLVVEKSTDSTEIIEVLNRYETLAATRSELSHQQAEALASIQTARAELTHTAREQALTIIGLQTTLADLRVQHQEAHIQAAKWSSILSRIRVFAAGKATEIEQVRSACLDLYKILCKLRKESMTVHETDTERQLTLITRHVENLKKAVTLVKNKIPKSLNGTYAMASNQPLTTVSSFP